VGYWNCINSDSYGSGNDMGWKIATLLMSVLLTANSGILTYSITWLATLRSRVSALETEVNQPPEAPKWFTERVNRLENRIASLEDTVLGDRLSSSESSDDPPPSSTTEPPEKLDNP